MTKTIIVADLASRTPNPPLGALLERADTASPPCPCQPPQAAPLALGLRERALVCTQLRRRRIRPLGLQRRHLEPPPSHGHSLARERCTRPSRGRRPRRCHPKSRRMLPVSSSSSVGGGRPVTTRVARARAMRENGETNTNQIPVWIGFTCTPSILLVWIWITTISFLHSLP